MRLSFLPVFPVYVFRRPFKCGYPVFVKFFAERDRNTVPEHDRAAGKKRSSFIRAGGRPSRSSAFASVRCGHASVAAEGLLHGPRIGRAHECFFPVSLRMTTVGLIMHLHSRQRIRPVRGDRPSPDRNARRAGSCRARRVRWRPIPAAESFCSSANTADR